MGSFKNSQRKVFFFHWRVEEDSVTNLILFSNIMAVLVPFWPSWLLICIRIAGVTCNHAGLSHLVHRSRSDVQMLTGSLWSTSTRTWKNLKKTKTKSRSELRFLFIQPPPDLFTPPASNLNAKDKLQTQKESDRKSSTGSFLELLFKLFSLTGGL